MSKFDDIINLDRPFSKREKMSLMNRAAQFSPFAALVGYDDIIVESGREVYDKIELNQQQKIDLNYVFVYLLENKDKEATFTYFKEDTLKDGGVNLTCKGKIKKFDAFASYIILDNGLKINLEDIVNIEI